MVNENTPDPTDISQLGDAAAAAAAQLDKLVESGSKSGDSLNTLGAFAASVKNEFSAFSDTLTKWGVSLNVTRNLTEAQTQQFGLMSVALVGVRDSFTNFSNVSTDNLNSFSKQLQYFEDTLGNTDAAIGKMVEFSKNAFNTMVPTEVIAKGAGAVKTFVEQLAKSADNALRVQNAYIQLSAKTGNLGEVFAAAGPNLENINALLEKQTAMMGKAVEATGAAPEVVQNYYSQLGTIPRALEETVRSGGSASETINMLTAAMKVSAGTGREYSDIVDDMKAAFRDYNLVGENALQFTVRMSEVSNKFGANLDAVRSALRDTASTFKMFGNEAEGAARILNTYVGALKSTGLSGDAAVEVVSQMTHGLKEMNIAQKAFLSAQTGGPGGLMGGFQIEKMLREGKIDEVMEKVRTQMQKQFGRIVTLEDAAKSPTAAAQMTRQMMILRQGPLGQFAKDDQTAIRMLEGFKSIQEGKTRPGELAKDTVQQSMDKGTQIQEKSYTELSRIRGILETTRGAADVANLGYVQRGMTAGVGTPRGVDTESQRRMRSGLTGFMTRGAVAGGQIGQDLRTDISTRAPIMDAGKRIAGSIDEFYKQMKDLPNSMKAPLDALKQAVKSGKTEDIVASAKKLEEDIKKAKADAAKKSKEERDRILANIRGEEAILKATREGLSPVRGQVFTPGVGQGRALGRAVDVGAAAGRVIGATRVGTAPGAPDREAATGGVRAGATPGKMGDVFVHVTGYCIKCKQQIESGDQVAAVNPAGVNT